MKTSVAAVKALIVSSPSDGGQSDDDEVHRVVGEIHLEGTTQAMLSSNLCNQLDLCPRKMDGARRTEEVRVLRALLDDVRERELIDQHVVDAGDLGAMRHTQCCRGVTLRIQIDDQDLRAHSCQGRGDVHGGGGLPHTALLIRHGQHTGFPGELDGGGLECAPTGGEVSEFPAQAVYPSRTIRSMTSSRIVSRETSTPFGGRVPL